MPFVRNLGKTNMLTEIPQDVSLELKDSTLTVKAGSKFYIPNGFEKTKKYYKDVVTTKYWKEITTGSKELEYAAYGSSFIEYAKVPINLNSTLYYVQEPYGGVATSSSELTKDVFSTIVSISESTLTVETYLGKTTSNRNSECDLYKDTTVTTTVEGTPEDYTYTTEETVTTEVTADDDWTRVEEADIETPKFDEFILENDFVVVDIPNNTTDLLFYSISAHGVAGWPTNLCYSGDTAPSVSGNWVAWYDTKNNVYKTQEGSSTWISRQYSLPFGIATGNKTAFTSIDQVFNGFGYIGSTIFALPGVKGLIPNGRNEDGSLKNIEFTVANVMVRTETSGDRDNQDLAISTSGIGINDYTYNHDENYLYTGSLKHQDRFVIGKISTSSGKITSFTPKKVGEGVIKTKLYNLATKKRTYYKYEYQDWTQPVATAATTAITGGNMVITASSTESSRKIYGALDGSMSAVSKAWLSSSSGAAWWQVKFPYKIKITGLTHYNPHVDASCAITSAQFFTSSSKTTPIGNSFSTPNTDWYKTVISGIPSEGIVTDTIYFSGVGGGYAGIGELVITAQKQLPAVETTEDEAEWYVDRLTAYIPAAKGLLTYRIYEKQRDTGTYTFTLYDDYEGKLLFVGNGGPGNSSQADSQWHYSGGGSGACFEGVVRLPADTYTLTIGTLGYGTNVDNTHYNSGGVASTDSYLTNSAGQELIRVGAGGKGYTSVGGVSGAAGVLKLGTLDVVETIKAVNGNTSGKTSATNFAVSAYDGTATGYGAGTGAERYQGNVYGVAGIFKLEIEYQAEGIRSY